MVTLAWVGDEHESDDEMYDGNFDAVFCATQFSPAVDFTDPGRKLPYLVSNDLTSEMEVVKRARSRSQSLQELYSVVQL